MLLVRDLAPDVGDTDALNYMAEGMLLAFASGEGTLKETEYSVLASSELAVLPFSMPEMALTTESPWIEIGEIKISPPTSTTKPSS